MKPVIHRTETLWGESEWKNNNNIFSKPATNRSELFGHTLQNKTRQRKKKKKPCCLTPAPNNYFGTNPLRPWKSGLYFPRAPFTKLHACLIKVHTSFFFPEFGFCAAISLKHMWAFHAHAKLCLFTGNCTKTHNLRVWDGRKSQAVAVKG